MSRPRIKKRPSTETQIVLNEVGAELQKNPPRIVNRTRAKYGRAAAQKQVVAIMLSKARRRGVKIKQSKKRSRKKIKFNY